VSFSYTTNKKIANSFNLFNDCEFNVIKNFEKEVKYKGECKYETILHFIEENRSDEIIGLKPTQITSK
jgi:hypothetical protein